MSRFFGDIAAIKYEGPESDNPLAYRYYNADEVILGKKMRDHLRMAVCYWHTFRGTALDIFGPGTLVRPWEDGSNSVDMAVKRTEVVLDFIGNATGHATARGDALATRSRQLRGALSA